ncbi:glycoside hydrolase family 64 protein, partial [Myriangium duriaei CBS 260.36]
MRFLRYGAALAAVVSQVLAGPTIAKPGGAKNIVVTKDNTLNSTHIPGVQILASSASTAGQLQLSLVNSLNSNNVNAYVTGLDNNGNLVMLSPDGSWYYPVAGHLAIPQSITANVSIPLGPKGSTTKITLPGYISAGRVWFADGTLQFFTVPGGSGTALVQPSAANPTDPNSDVNWGFVELTNISSGIYVNLSYVDFLGIPLGIQLIGSAGTQTVQGVTANAVGDVCADLTTQAAKEGQPWDSLCVADTSGSLIRVLSPALYLTINSTGFAGYWTEYINQVWSKYSTTSLNIDTQASPGVVACKTSNGTLSCAGGATKYAQPSPLDIFSCASGTFYIQSYDAVNLAVIPRLCAAFNRATLLLNNGNTQPYATESQFYSSSPANWYSHFVHTHELDGKGYAFSYDDVTADNGSNLSGLLADPNPSILAVTVGGP